jgi:hypothetical protein
VCTSFSFRTFIVAMILGNTLMTSVENPYMSITNKQQIEVLAQVDAALSPELARSRLTSAGFTTSGLRIYLLRRDGAQDLRLRRARVRQVVPQPLRRPREQTWGSEPHTGPPAVEVRLTRAGPGAAQMVFMFLLEWGLNFGGVKAGGLFSAMRTFRVLRIFKLARNVEVFRVLLTKMARAVATVFPMIIVLNVFLFIFAVFSMQLLTGMYDQIFEGVCDDAMPWKTDPLGEHTAWHEGEAYDAWWRAYTDHCVSKPRWHFDEFQHAFLTVFQVMTCDNWPWIMWDTFNAFGSFAFVLFPVIIILGNFVALNLFLAILLANFTEADTDGTDEDRCPSLRRPAPLPRLALAPRPLHLLAPPRITAVRRGVFPRLLLQPASPPHHSAPPTRRPAARLASQRDGGLPRPR